MSTRVYVWTADAAPIIFPDVDVLTFSTTSGQVVERAGRGKRVLLVNPANVVAVLVETAPEPEELA